MDRRTVSHCFPLFPGNTESELFPTVSLRSRGKQLGKRFRSDGRGQGSEELWG